MRSCLFWLFITSLPFLARAEDQAVSANPSLSVIAKAPGFTLQDLSGQPVRLSDYRGQAIVLAFIFTTCKSVCPLISQQMASLQKSLKSAGLFGKKASLISITVDPERDTAPVLATYSKNFGVDKTGWRFLRESPGRVKAVLEAYDEWTKLLPDGDMDHPARIYLIDPKGQIRDIYSLAFFNDKQVFIDIQALLK